MAPRKTTAKTQPEGSDTAQADAKAKADADAKAAAEAEEQAKAEAKAKAKADADANAEAEKKAKAEAEERAKTEAAQKAVPKTRAFDALCHVQRDGIVVPPGAPLELTRNEFEELKALKAVSGDFDD